MWEPNGMNAGANAEDIAKLEDVLRDLDATKQRAAAYQSQILAAMQDIVGIWNNSRKDGILKKDENDAWQIETLSQYRN